MFKLIIIILWIIILVGAGIEGNWWAWIVLGFSVLFGFGWIFRIFFGDD